MDGKGKDVRVSFRLAVSDKSEKELGYWDDIWVRLFLHVPHGFGMGYFLMLNPALGVGFLVLCVFYQFIEDWRIRDLSFYDVRGYLAGFPCGALTGFITQQFDSSPLEQLRYSLYSLLVIIGVLILLCFIRYLKLRNGLSAEAR